MLNTLFAIKQDMTQAWTKQGKRLAITKLKVDDNVVVGQQKCQARKANSTDLQQYPCYIFEIGFGKKKLKNVAKPLRERIKKSGFSFGLKQIKGVKVFLDEVEEAELEKIKPGQTIDPTQVIRVGDVVKVQGQTKGRGFAGVVKKFKFAGGPRTHGQSDRLRAPGSIGAGTDPGRVWKNKKMPGHFGAETRTVINLTVVYYDDSTQELWVSGPVPGHFGATVKIVKTAEQKKLELDLAASGIKEQQESAEKQEEKSAEEPTKKQDK